MALTQAQARQMLQFIRNGSLRDLHAVLSAFVEGDFNAIAGVTASAAELNILDGATLDVNELNTLDGVTATAAEINMAADNSANCEVVSTTNVITAAESGKTFFLDLAGGFVSTLPAPALGLRFRFVVKTAPTTAYTIVTNSSANVIMGGLTESTIDTAAPVDTNADTISFVANTALAGDWVEVISDGTNWYLIGGNAAADGGIALSTAS